MNNKAIAEELKLLSSKDNIPLLYSKVMQGFSENNLESSAAFMVDGYNHKLYAPGYEENGIADVVAKCI